MKTLKGILKFFLYFFSILIVLMLFMVGYYCMVVGVDEPRTDGQPFENEFVEKEDNGCRRLGKNWLRQNRHGLWEVYVEGEPYERGVALGKLEKELMYYQESVFVKQIDELVPSRSYVRFLKCLILFFNRNLDEYVPSEYQQEILGTTVDCTHEFDYIGTPYERQLNYHAAHDLGHAMQDYMLVGCTSFGAWGSATSDSSILVGRNFDFYMGDDFARNKVVSFYNPTSGYRFAMVGWAGMVGAVSGMNDQGLTVTINAAKSAMPTSSATPISILARKILQYASTIDEAMAIADTTRTFVSESILVGSKKDGRTAILEKSVEKCALYAPKGNTVICANHYQGKAFADDERNKENIETSDSPYRFHRAEQLVSQNLPLDYHKAISVLRDVRGMDGLDIGLGNEKAVNQLIAHHSVVFDATHLRMWVSTAPWQLGEYVCYDLNSVFSANPNGEVCDTSLCEPPSDFVMDARFVDFLRYRELRRNVCARLRKGEMVDSVYADSLVLLNPSFFQAYDIAGDICKAANKNEKAVEYWQKALTLEIPKQGEKKEIEKKIFNARENN